MIPGDEKASSGHLAVDHTPPLPPGAAAKHLQLNLGSISKENSVSSFASDATTVTAGSISTPTSVATTASNKIKSANGKHQNLKRVSFGSSKGSMVETLIYEAPPEGQPSPIIENTTPFPEDDHQTQDEREKVRVSFVQQLKLQEVVLPDDSLVFGNFHKENDYLVNGGFAMALTGQDGVNPPYHQQESTDNGWDNPFRPGGDLSREADEIVELIKGGKPITPTSANASFPIDENDANSTISPKKSNQLTSSPTKSPPASSTPKNAKNGNVDSKETDNNSVDVRRGNASVPGDASQVEHVVIKKKQKCECCVIQ